MMVDFFEHFNLIHGRLHVRWVATLDGGAQRSRAPFAYIDERSDLNAARSSVLKSSGSSHAAK